MHSRSRLAGVIGLAAGAAVVLAGCSGSSSSGHPPAPATSSALTSASQPVVPPSSSPAVSDTPTQPPVADPTACSPKAAFCDTFSDTGSGWPVDNAEHFYAGYDDYLGGTYRLGERTNAAISQVAPVEITEIAHDYSVQLDVDATLGSQMPAGDIIGFTCWEHEIEGGNGATSAFLIEVNQTEAKIGLWDDVTGDYHEIASKPAHGVLDPSGTNHLTAVCIQGNGRSGVEAVLGLKVNRKVLVTAKYAKTAKTYDWSVGKQVGLLAAGEGADVFYDNFAIRSQCQSYC